jgi:hypothetical protein
MNPTRTSRFLQALLSALPLLFLVVPIAAARDPFAPVSGPTTNGYQESAGDVWKESKVMIPPYPADANLVPLPPGPRDTLRVYIDAPSVTLAPDAVLRLTLVVVSSGGARNVFYDGLRCATKEYKTYAFGTDVKTMEPMRGAHWRPIPRFPTNAFRYDLYHDYACDESLLPRSPDDLLHQLKYTD